MLNRSAPQSGFSLLEMLVVLLIGAMLMSIATLSLTGIQSNAVQSATVSKFDSDLSRLRSEALSAGVRTVINTNGTGTGYVAGLDVLPYGATATINQQVLSEHLADNITMTANQQIIFDSRGFVVDNLGLAASHTIDFRYRGATFCTASISVTGGVSFSCRS